VSLVIKGINSIKSSVFWLNKVVKKADTCVASQQMVPKNREHELKAQVWRADGNGLLFAKSKPFPDNPC